MRIDVISIFPDYLAPLELSLLGKARQEGLVDVQIHNLRDFAFDRHKTVDDTPYGGGAGMVMKAEPWGLALDRVLAQSPVLQSSAGADQPQDDAAAASARAEGEKPLLIVPSPAGTVFNQQLAYELAQEEHIAFAPARYEGIDERVLDWSEESFRVMPVSIGDYVLYGGEVAVMVMLEAIIRLIPGAMGNPESLAEESHTGGLLEYPVYTKPAQWRGREVPEILLSGNHGAIARWRRDEQIKRTFSRRYDMIASASDEMWDKKDRKLLIELRTERKKQLRAAKQAQQLQQEEENQQEQAR
ncbi:tRNA (guanosine(37)-N1)-methyltransferase TrmD [Rothia aerolata]|uniref:tRNA (guanine-N(1)-)-methyltransferase n=1 Tax=Rothia aerolata TaxID=1812262 RepID=A0A917MQN9_9MICC|nr:tRNA (guanosine(37)-N1)-methyltransferase TrmD [Rothia aerolata]GGH58598.1 tRNA (guanine-N(1)-)-methyltransferase [Rothia aerolata]